MAQLLAAGQSIPKNAQGDDFISFCPSITLITQSFPQNVWPTRYRFFLQFIIDTVKSPFADTVLAPLPDCLAQPKAENYLVDGHCYDWPIIRDGKTYPDFANADGSCRKKEDRQTNSKNLIPGIFICVCRHQVNICAVFSTKNLQICYGFHLMTDPEGRKDLFYTLYERWPADKLKQLTVVSCVVIHSRILCYIQIYMILGVMQWSIA